MADSPRMTALQNLAGQLPVANSQIAAGQSVARSMQLQQAVGTPGATPTGVAAAQQTGTQLAGQAGQQAQQRAQQGVQQVGQVASEGIQQQGVENQAQVFGLSQGEKKQEMDNLQKFSALSEDAKQQLYDEQMQFQKDELGRTQLNTIQMADLASTTAQNQEQYKNYAQQATQMTDRNLQVMETGYQKIAQDMQNKYEAARQSGDQATQMDIAQKKQAYDKQIQLERAKAANNQAAWTSGMTVAAMGTAAALGAGPAVILASGALGAAGGGMVGSQQSYK